MKVDEEYRFEMKAGFDTEAGQQIRVMAFLPYECLAMVPRHLLIEDAEHWKIDSVIIGGRAQDLKSGFFNTIQSAVSVEISATPQKNGLTLRAWFVGKGVCN